MLNSSKTAKILKTNIISDHEIDVILSYKNNYDLKKDYYLKILQIEDKKDLDQIILNFKENKPTNNSLIKNKSKLTYKEYDVLLKDLNKQTDFRFKTESKFDDLNFLAYVFFIYMDDSKIAEKLKIKNLNKLNSLLKIVEFDYGIIKDQNSIVHRTVIENKKISKKPQSKDFFVRENKVENFEIISEIYTSYQDENKVENFFYIYPQNIVKNNTFYPDFFKNKITDFVIDVFATDKSGKKIKCKFKEIDKFYICQFEDLIDRDTQYTITITFKDLSVSFFEEVRPEILKYITPLSNIISLSNDDRYYNFDKNQFNYNLISANAQNIYFVIDRIIYINNIIAKDQLNIEDFAFITNKSISYEDIYIIIDKLKSLLAIVDEIYLNYNLKSINSIDVNSEIKYNKSNMLFKISSFEEDVFKINNIVIEKETQNIELENFENVNKLYLKNINKFSYEDAFFEYGYKQLSQPSKLSNYISLSNVSQQNRDVLYRKLKNEYEKTYTKLYFNKIFSKNIQSRELSVDEYSLIYVLNNIEYKLFYWDITELNWKKVLSPLQKDTLYKFEEYNKPNVINSKLINQYFLV